MAHYDVVVLGCGPAGERAAIQAARAGKRVAVVERAHVVGGNRVNWGTIPSKTLRESAVFFYQLTRNRLHGIRYEVDPELTVADFMFRERAVVARELELINESLGRYAVELVHGHARFAGPRAVVVQPAVGEALRTLTLTADFFVIATGSRPNRPDDVPFDGETVFDSETILHLPRMPRTMTVLGAGVVGIEYASIFAALGLAVTLVDTRDRLLPYLDREIVGVLVGELQRLGVTILHDERYARIERLDGEPKRVAISTRGGKRLETDVLLYCVGRDGNTSNIGLETLGISPGRYGLLEVNESYQTSHPHIYAVGDVIGYPALASTSMEQGRQAMRHAFSIPGPKGRTEVLPFAVYSIPEVAYIGETEETLGAKGRDYVAGRGNYDMNPRGQILGESGGLLKLLFERPSLRLVGAHVVGASASEIIHVGEAFLKAGATAADIAETLYNYPTLSDMYRHAALKALGEDQRRKG
jgi:NAD(P) transhydrogenase